MVETGSALIEYIARAMHLLAHKDTCLCVCGGGDGGDLANNNRAFIPFSEAA